MGATFGTITGLSWGGQFVIGASALHRVDAFPLTTLRYAFGNLIPVTTFAIETVRGYRPGVVELGGAALTIGALVASNLYARRSAKAPVPSIAVERETLAEAA